MIEPKTAVVVGLGEIGKPILDLLSSQYNTFGVDVSTPIQHIEHVDVLHICYPFQIEDFVRETARYIELFKPELTIIHSTLAIGTTRSVATLSGADVVHSPVRGKHAAMLAELRTYKKYVGALDIRAGHEAARHFEDLGVTTQILSSPEATELAKLTETTYFGVIIAWAQEVERYCDLSGQNYDEVVSFYEQIPYLPQVKFFPGVIGGHCVMPNIELLTRFHDSNLLSAIEASNNAKVEREKETRRAKEGETLAVHE